MNKSAVENVRSKLINSRHYAMLCQFTDNTIML